MNESSRLFYSDSYKQARNRDQLGSTGRKMTTEGGPKDKTEIWTKVERIPLKQTPKLSSGTKIKQSKLSSLEERVCLLPEPRMPRNIIIS